MDKQINFTITPEKEKELINFVINECNCRMLLPFLNGEKAVVEEGESLSLPAYYIYPNACELPLNYECGIDIDGSQKQMLSTTLEGYVPNFYPFIQYNRLFDEDNILYGRFYCTFLSQEYNVILKHLYTKLKKWVKHNSKKKDGSFGMAIYTVE